MKLSKKQINVLIILALTFLSCSLTYQLVIKGCIWWTCAPERNFEMTVLELPITYFAGGSDVRPLDDSIRGEIYGDEYSQWVGWKTGRAYFEVVEYVSINKASKAFQRKKVLNDFTSELDSLEKYEGVLSFYPSKADAYSIECGYELESRRCIYQARYEEYYIYFSSTINARMPPDRYLMIITNMDQQITTLLELD